MPLPFPGSPACSWPVFIDRLRALFRGADLRVCASFWTFGLINNVLYVIILSAALDLVGPSIPKSVVLLVDVIPALVTKLVAPYFIHAVPYALRICIFVGLSMAGMMLIATAPPYNPNRPENPIGRKMLGIIAASLSSGAGELSFVGMTHRFGPFSLAAWGSGTGAAGLVGAGAYALVTSKLGWSVRAVVEASAALPLIMFLTYFVLLPPFAHPGERAGYESLEDEEVEDAAPEAGELLAPLHDQSKAWSRLRRNLRRTKSLFFPFMLPLLLVYVAEYTINQGVAPTLLFPLESTPFDHYRSFYPTYNAIYQVGVFLSRSSTPFFRVHHLYAPSFLQIANLVLLICHSLFDFIPSVYFIFVIILWEGLLGGLVYVNTFAEIGDRVPPSEREFSLGATTVSDSAGICLAGFLGMVVEIWLCDWQISVGRDYCKKF